MQESTKQLVNSITTGEHSEGVNKFCRSAVDFVERRVGASEDTRAVNEALDREVRKFLDEHPGSGCAITNTGRIMETGPFRPVGKFTEFFPISGKTST